MTVPEAQRGPRPMALKPQDWNTMALTLADDTLTLQLNGAEIYRHRLEPGDSRLFGLLLANRRDSAEVRNVVLTGNWPETLTPEQLGNLIAPRPGP